MLCFFGVDHSNRNARKRPQFAEGFLILRFLILMKALYNTAISLFPVILRLAAPFHVKARQMTTGRKHWKKQITDARLNRETIWIHCASLGEFEQGRPIIESLKSTHPDHNIVVTFFSSSGYEVRKKYESADLVMYLPFDTRSNAIDFLELLRPKLVLFIKYEFWNNYLTELKKRNIPVLLVSGIFRPDQKFFKKGWPFFRNMLLNFEHFFVQDEVSKALLQSIGIQNITVSGDTRFDRVLDICSKPRQIRLAEKFASTGPLMVVGSSWPDDMEVLLPLINQNKLKFIIAPHEIEKSKIRKMAGDLQVSYVLYSEANEENIENTKVLIIDNIGMLSSLYQYGDMAYIGGAFGDGLHNILEAATFGLPIIFGRGKDNHKYREAPELLELGGAFEVSDSEELNKIAERLIIDKELRLKASQISAKYVREQAGATAKIMKYIGDRL